MVDMLEAKHKLKYDQFSRHEAAYNENSIFLDGYNGADLSYDPKKKVNARSFSSQIFNEEAFVKLVQIQLVSAY